MNTPTQSDPVMEMARKIAFQVWLEDQRRIDPSCVEHISDIQADYSRGIWDSGPYVKSALAAIRATTDAAIEAANLHRPYRLSEDEWMVTRSIRSRLGKPSPERIG